MAFVNVPSGSSQELQPEFEPDHTQLPESDGTFVKNFQEHPQSLTLTSSLEPVLQKLHPDGRYCIGQDSGIYWRRLSPPEDPVKGAEAPDWFYVPNVSPLINGEYRRSYVMWKEKVVPLIALEFVSGNGAEERDRTPLGAIDPKTGEPQKPGKFWVYEQGIQIPFYGIYEVSKALLEVYHLVEGRYQRMVPNHRNHYEIAPIGVELGLEYDQTDQPIPWLRWWDREGNLLLTGNERAAQAEIMAERERLISAQAREEKAQAEAIATQARQEQAQAETIATQAREEKAQAEAIAAQARQEQAQAEAIATQARQEQAQAETIATQDREKMEKLAAYLRSIGVNPEEIL
jgi:hypothetical protein